MRASAKATDGTSGSTTVGRFGVGFSAVRALSDEIAIRSAGGGVRFSARAARALLSQAATATDLDRAVASTMRQVLERPLADLPILRLPFPLDDVPHDDSDGDQAADPTAIPIAGTVPPGYDTAVVALLRGPAERDLARRLLDAVDDALPLALPALAEIRVEVDGEEPRVLAAVEARWLTVHVEGRHRDVDLVDRPHEERRRTRWLLTWAAPRIVTGHGGPGAAAADRSENAVGIGVGSGTGSGSGTGTGTGSGAEVRDHVHEPHVVHAPTPTDEPCTLPALLIATFPLDPSRRHVAPGPATDALARRAGEAYGELAERVADAGDDSLALVPTGLPAGRLDALLRSAALEALTRRPLLQPAGPPHAGQPARLAPREAQAVAGPVGHDGRALAALHVPGLVAVPRGPDALTRLRALGVELRDLGDVVDALPLARDPHEWRALYDALAPHVTEPGVADALSGLPVPLVDGRTVRGPRGLVAPAGAVDAAPAHPDASTAHLDAVAALAPWGLRVIDPAGAHPLLTRLGAVEADARTLLSQEAVRAAVRALADGDVDDDRSAAVASAVLGLVASALAAGADPAEIAASAPWLGNLPIEDDDGEPTPARHLTIPDGWADRVLDALRPVAADVVERHGPDVLRAVGVRDGLTVVRVAEVVAEEGVESVSPGDGPEDTLDGWFDYVSDLAEALGPGAYVGELAAVADLDAVAEDAWPQVLADLAEDPPARAALLGTVRVEGREAPSYTSWWLRDFLDAPFAAPGADVPFLPPAPAEVGGPEGASRLGGAVLAALGAVTDLGDLDRAGWERYLDALPDVGSTVPIEQALAVWRGLAAAVAHSARHGLWLAPDRVPVLHAADDGDAPRASMVAAEDARVAAGPMWSQVADVVPAPPAAAEALAEALDVALLDDAEAPRIAATEPEEVPTPPGARALVPAAPATYVECADLTVDAVPVEWWVTGSQVYAATTAGLARGLAHAGGRWSARAMLEAVLADPGRAPGFALEAAWDAP